MKRPTRHTDGLYLSARDLGELEAAARILHAPFAYGDLDSWRSAVNKSLCGIVRADLAMFYLAPGLEGPAADRALVWSDELSQDQLGNFIRYALNDAGSEQVGSLALSLVSQRSLVGDNWDGYHADPAVNAFYLPTRLVDSVGLMSWSREGTKQASIEIHSDRFGTPLFGREGIARLRLLLPAFQASVLAIVSAGSVDSDLTILLEELGQPFALADARGRLTHRSRALNHLVVEDPDSVQLTTALETLAQSHAALFEARGFGHQHRVAGTSLTSAQKPMSVIRTWTRQYRVFIVTAPDSLTSGRLAFLLRVEPDFGATIPTLELHAHFALTAREVQVARLLATGINNDEVASALHISAHTARRHTEKVFLKLHAHSRAEVGAILRGAAQSSPEPRPTR